MKVAIIGESPADEAAYGVLVESILGNPVERIDPSLRRRPSGWPHVIQRLPSIIKYLYHSTNAHRMVIVVDSDHTPLHGPSHDDEEGSEPDCRLCQMRWLIARETSRLPTLATRSKLLTAAGLAVPCLEAWLLCGTDKRASEATWRQFLHERADAGRIRQWKLELKQKVYGTDRPGLERETRCGVNQAQRLAANLDILRHHFPGGFGPSESDLKHW